MNAAKESDFKSASAASPLSPADRVVSADVLRGLAILGILLMNIAAFSGQAGSLDAWPETIDRAIFILTRLLIEAKFYSLFSFLFGWGMAIQIKRLEKRGASPAATLLRRLAILLLMGVIHAVFIWSGDILAVYALCGLVLLLFRRRSDRVLLAASALFLLAAILIHLPSPSMSVFRTWYTQKIGLLTLNVDLNRLHLDGSYWEATRARTQEFLQVIATLPFTFGKVFAMFLLGFFAGKRGLLRRAGEGPRWMLPLIWTAMTVGIVLNVIYVMTLTGLLSLAGQQSRFVGNAARTLGAPIMMLFYVAAVVHLMRREVWAKRLSTFADVGRMALSNYILQSVVATLLFYGYGLGMYGRVDPSFTLMLSLLLYVFQVRLSRWWLSSHRFGPLEWVWRSLTYGKLQPWYAQGHEDARPALLRSRAPQLRGLSPMRMLVAIWFSFLAWSAALLVWDARLDRERSNVPPAQTAAVQKSESDFFFNMGERDGIAAPQPKATPALDPPHYAPSPLLVSGELYAFGMGIDVEQALQSIEDLSSAPFAGRQAGTPGGHAAAEYIAARFEEFGLQPAGDQGTYFQTFPVEVLTFSIAPSLSVRHRDKAVWERYNFLEDFAVILRQYAGGGSARGQLVWANHCTHDDFDAIVVLEQIVVCQETPGVKADREALEHGAAGLLLMAGPDALPLDFSRPYHEALVPEPIPVFIINQATMQDVLEGSAWNLNDLLLSFSSFALGIEVRMEAQVSGPEACSPQGCIGRNVLGVIPGRDPEIAHELVVIGAHYDHMGASPDGTFWPGANDDASGVAVLLEIARLWQEHGYAPRRTVLFAAWDAEELGLVGSQYYVEQPVFPMDATVAMLQLDMVGAGSERLYIDGGGALTPRLSAIAGQLGLETRSSDHGRSDHGPFLRAGVPANLLIWFGGDNSLSTYHRPKDVVENLEIHKLDSAAKVTHLALLSLAEGEPALQELLRQRETALRENDLQAFLQSSSDARKPLDRAWFADFQSLRPDDVTLSVRSAHVIPEGSAALVELHYTIPSADDEQRIEKTLTWPVRFLSTADGWRWHGADLQPAGSSDSLDVDLFISRTSGVESVPERLQQLILEKYRSMTALLGLPQELRLEVQLFESADALRASTSLSLSSTVRLWTAPGEMRLVFDGSQDLEPLLNRGLAHVLLTELGFSRGEPAWLWGGLPLLLEERLNPEAFQRDHLERLRFLLEGEGGSNGATAEWAVLSYLRDQTGWRGLGTGLERAGEVCRRSDCSQANILDSALWDGFGLTTSMLEENWRRVWSSRIQSAQSALDDLLTSRNTAWRDGDLPAFLETVDPDTPGLILDQQQWYQNSQSEGIQTLIFSGSPMLLSDDELLAEVTMEIVYVDEAGESKTRTTSSEVRFTKREQDLRWAGSLFESIESGRISIYYPPGQNELAQHLLAMADPVLTDVPRFLGISPDLTYRIKLYTDSSAYQASISPLALRPSRAESWSMADPTIKFFVPDGRVDPTTTSNFANALIRNTAYQSGIASEWLLRALYVELSPLFDGGRTQHMAGTQLFELFKVEDLALAYDLNELPPERELEPDENKRIDALAWDILRFIRYASGEGAFRLMLRRIREGVSLEDSLLEAAGLDMRSLLGQWWGSFRRGHAAQDWIDAMMSFDEDSAMAAVHYLADDAFEGRLAGSQVSEIAARWIAGRFEAYGLDPPLPAETDSASAEAASGPSSGSEPGSETQRSFLQTVPLEYTELTGTPSLQITHAAGVAPDSFVYRSDFRLAPRVISGGGSVEGALVWVLDDTYAGMNLSGKIVLRPNTENTPEDLRRAVEHGAVGLLYVGSRAGTKELLEKTPLQAADQSRESIPVLELTQEGFEKIRDALGVKFGDLYNGPPAQLFDIHARLQIPLETQVEATSFNVLGLMPGSNPALAHEVLILSAHSDHVGYEPAPELCEMLGDSEGDSGQEPCTPEGLLRYPGLNDDASGVAVLLEIARLWHAAGYRPQRSVLFAVWTGQEYGELGSRYYLDHPALPLEQVRAVVHLDSVGGGTGYYLEAHYDWETDAEPLFYLFAAEQLASGRLSRTSREVQNDHSVFQAQGIPSLLLRWRGSTYENLPHGYDDDVEPARLGSTGRMVGLALMMMAR